MAKSDHKGDGAPPSNIHVGPATKKTNWLPWILLGLGILALLFGLRRCSHNESARVAPVPSTLPAPATGTAPAPAATAPVTDTAAVPAGTSGVGTYLGGT